MFITPSYFIGEINIPNTGTPNVDAKINLFIEQYEPQCLEGILGYQLYKTLLAEYEIEEPAIRMNELVNGKEYMYNDKLFKWRGLIYGNTPNLYSLIAYYVYYHIKHDDAIWNSGIGTVVPKGDQVIANSPGFKMTWAFNKFAEMGRQLCYFLYSNTAIYPEWDDAVLQTSAVEFTRTINDFNI